MSTLDPSGRIEIAHVGDTAVWTWSATAGLRRWTVDQHVAHMLTNPGLTTIGREVLTEHGDQVVTALADYVLDGLALATIPTISWTPLRGPAADADLLIVTSDGVHKTLTTTQLTTHVEQHATDAQALADALVPAAVTTAPADPDDIPDNATGAAIRIAREG